MMKQEVSVIMAAKIFKILTLLISLSFCSNVVAKLLIQEKMKKNLRWELSVPKKQILLDSRKNSLLIKTLNFQLYRDLISDLKRLKLDESYFKKLSLDDGANLEKNASIIIELKNKNVKFFSFYKNKEKKYIIDFWIENPIPGKIKKNNLFKKKVLKKRNVLKSKKKEKKKKRKIVKLNKKNSNKIKPKKTLNLGSKEYRDFRYGAPFIWDYQPIVHRQKEIINIARKTPDFFYKIKNRDFEKSKKEAHLQLTINLYRKKKYGLMSTSMKLFNNKYDDNSAIEIHDYLKANAILKNNMEKGERRPLKVAISLLSSLAKRTKNYELSKGILKYLISYYLKIDEKLLALNVAKILYVKTRAKFDFEESTYAAEVILSFLALVGRSEKIDELLKEKEIVDLLSKQKTLGYQSYALLKNNKSKRVVSIFEDNEKVLAKPIAKELLFNTAEAYFRQGKYKESIRLFDEFIKHYSFSSYASKAWLRMALSYEILGKNKAQTLSLYKRAINKAISFDVSYEAKLRYVSLRNLRKYKPNKLDVETRIFLERKKNVRLNKNLSKLLWLVRLRLFITDGEYQKALTYLNAVPLISLKNRDKGTFIGDGAEIIVGLIQNNFVNGNYNELVKIWDIYKDVYVKKVGNDPFLNYLVAHSYLKLGFYESFNKFYKTIGNLNLKYKRTYPIWIPRKKIKNIIDELKISKNLSMREWKKAKKNIDALIKKDPSNLKANLFLGKLYHKTKNYKKSISNFEKYVSSIEENFSMPPNELADFINEYLGSIYEDGDINKFRKVGDAILNDVNGFKEENKILKKSKERLSYLIIESIFSENISETFVVLENKIKNFKKRFKNSIYENRTDYILGLSLINNKKENEGEKIFRSILKRKKISNHLKELVNSELTLLKINNRTI